MKPNIIYILSDQHNPSVMGCAADKVVRTPNLDAFSAKSVNLDNCYCAAPLCVPSRSSILSGLMPCHNGVYNNMQALSSDKATFVNSLSINGYETVLSGRMHFVGADQRHGYEKRFVGDITPCYIGADNEEEIYGSFKRSSGQNLTSVKKSGAGYSAVFDFDDDVTSAACDYLHTRTDTRPLFMTVGFYGPHCPYIAPEKLYNYYYEKLAPLQDTSEEKANIHPAIKQWYKNREMEAVTNDDLRRIRAAYYSMVEYMDGLVGKVLNAIEKTVGLDNTIVIYGSDHGDNIGEHGLLWKTNFYDGAARVPMMFSWKGHFAEGTHISSPTSLLDLAPTLLSITNAPSLTHYDGKDLSCVLNSGEDIDTDRAVISLCSDIKGDNPSAMVRKGRYKLIYYAGYEHKQLFDLVSDKDELHDLGKDASFAKIIDEMSLELVGLWDETTAMKELDDAKINFKLMQKWHKIANLPIVEEWRGNAENNYLI
ncbi:MAG: sulfatase-like hydrolase/transferase [Oscillospiraceae bacterium]